MHLIRTVLLCVLASGLFACSGKPVSTNTPAAPGSGHQASVAKSARQLAAEAVYAQAIELMRRGKTTGAVGLLEQMTRNFSEFSGPYINLGIIYVKQNRLKDAEKVLTRAVSMNRHSVQAHNQLGIVYRKTGQFTKARQSYENALRVNPNYPLAHLNLGILYDLYLGRLALALRHYQHYQQLTPKKDKVVANWIIDLKRRSQSTSSTLRGGDSEKTERVSRNP